VADQPVGHRTSQKRGWKDHLFAAEGLSHVVIKSYSSKAADLSAGAAGFPAGRASQSGAPRSRVRLAVGCASHAVRLAVGCASQSVSGGWACRTGGALPPD